MMTKRATVTTFTLVGSLLLFLTASPVSAAAYCYLDWVCNCTASCTQTCYLPGGQRSTCGAWGICEDVCPNFQATSTTSVTTTPRNDTLNGEFGRECTGGNDSVDTNAGDDRIDASTGTGTEPARVCHEETLGLDRPQASPGRRTPTGHLN